jgi:hypothetical protein
MGVRGLCGSTKAHNAVGIASWHPKPAIIFGFPECVQGDLTRRAVISAPQVFGCSDSRNGALRPRMAGFKSSSPELNLKE